MNRGNTKYEILEASLDLFSLQGFEATSISQIASAVGIRKASLYSHFENKQAILDALVKEVLEKYGEHSIFAKTDWEKGADNLPLTPDDAVQMIGEQIRYILHDPYISKARKMLVIEQFQNPELARLQTKQNYSDVLGYFTVLVKQLICQGVLAEDDSEIMAAQLCLPISVWINLCDREPERESEVMGLVSKHIRQFFRRYQRSAMIRPFRENDLFTVMQIWLDANIKSHSFISKDYWTDNYAMVKEILPQAEIYVCEDSDTNQIDGFIGLTDNYIEGIFVREDMRSRGIGKQLLDYAKEIKSSLRLSVYQKNIRAIAFYQREQFIIHSESIDDSTNEKEFIMTWNK